MTDDEIESLRWFLENEPSISLGVTLLPNKTCRIWPTDEMRRRLCRIGLLEKIDVGGLYRFQTTEAGREILANNPPIV